MPVAAVGKTGKIAGVLFRHRQTVADQLGHTLDVSQNVYTRASVARRKKAVDALESALPGR